MSGPDDEVEPRLQALSERDREILELEKLWFKFAGAKEQAIRDRFNMTSTRYYQVLNSLIDTEPALAAEPVLVKRLRRLRSDRQRSRSARRLGIES
ncbi:DUF3263 domain-containing protein [Aeromicrobium endophyticum]|uniref:DUF3263 domain-containing protein n=1 Tax=Aeromicrobium endophyticum TaxID=2292704 RepID=A0A371PCM8_9ACTN|nr:DUF3263 domain-containing protein [Aeromicrobium endophyticum]REK73685.1 DUF3263 domain-containing protein [Aeromicrobium endophyticum]